MAVAVVAAAVAVAMAAAAAAGAGAGALPAGRQGGVHLERVDFRFREVRMGCRVGRRASPSTWGVVLGAAADSDRSSPRVPRIFLRNFLEAAGFPVEHLAGVAEAEILGQWDYVGLPAYDGNDCGPEVRLGAGDAHGACVRAH